MTKYVIPSKEDMLKYYITENHSKKECADHFNTTVSTFTVWLTKYNIVKLRSNRCVDLPEISADLIKDYFITQCHTIEECVKYFDISEAKFKALLFQYNIQKTPIEVAQTIARTTKDKYGVAYYKTEEVKAKTRATCLDKYGVDNPSKNEDVKKKISQAESYVIPSKEELYQLFIVENMKRSDLAKFYNVSESICTKWLSTYSIVKDENLKNQNRYNTNMERYGYGSYTQTPEFIQNNIDKNMEKYGVKNYAQKDINHIDVWVDVDKLKQFFESQNPKMTSYDAAAYFNVCISALLKKIHECGLEDYIDYKAGRSHYENEIIDFLVHDCKIALKDIITNDRSVLQGQEIDIYIPKKKFGIEFNGEYWHCELQAKYSDHKGRSTTHQAKSLLAEKNGVFLFQIFEHEWDERFIEKNSKLVNSKDQIKNRIKSILLENKTKIPARKCNISELTYDQKKEFLNHNHIQGNDISSSIYLGLYYKEKLVVCMTFGKSKYTKYQWELSRFCNLQNTNVIGGASKLLKYFLNNYAQDGNKIVSYNDITKTKGTLYETLGFSCESINDPNYWWVNLDNYDMRSRYQEQEAGEIERMHNQGYVRITDCGTKTWVYTK